MAVTWSGGATVQIAVDVTAPPGAVWAIMSDVVRWPEWTASVSRVRLLTPGPLATGSRVLIQQPKFPPAVWRVTALTHGESFT